MKFKDIKNLFKETSCFIFKKIKDFKLEKIEKSVIPILSVMLITSLLFSISVCYLYHNSNKKYKSLLQNPKDLNSSQIQEVFNQVPDQSVCFDYQTKYNDLYASSPIPKVLEPQEKTVYLTFDDGPSNNTQQILDILNRYDVKATFFIVPKQNELSNENLKKIHDSNNVIGVHSFSHVYKQIYSSVDAFLDDFNNCSSYIKNITGVSPEIIRLPGGSINGYNSSISVELLSEVSRRGFVYFDWNVDSTDASHKLTPTDTIVQNVINGVVTNKTSIILMHDCNTKTTTIEALPRIIETLKGMGYNFSVIDRTTPRVLFSYPNNQ